MDFLNHYAEGNERAVGGLKILASSSGYIVLEYWHRTEEGADPLGRQRVGADAYQSDDWVPMIAKALKHPGARYVRVLYGHDKPGDELHLVGELTVEVGEDGILRLGETGGYIGPRLIEVAPEDQEWVLKTLRRAKRRLGLAGRL